VDDLQRSLLPGEAALGEPHDEPRAAAFPTGALTEPAAALLALLTSTCRLASAAAQSPTDALAIALRARCWLEFVELHFFACPSISRRYPTLSSIPRVLSLTVMSLVSPVLRRPRALTVARWSFGTPMRLCLSVTFTPRPPAPVWRRRRSSVASGPRRPRRRRWAGCGSRPPW